MFIASSISTRQNLGAWRCVLHFWILRGCLTYDLDTMQVFCFHSWVSADVLSNSIRSVITGDWVDISTTWPLKKRCRLCDGISLHNRAVSIFWWILAIHTWKFLTMTNTFIAVAAAMISRTGMMWFLLSCFAHSNRRLRISIIVCMIVQIVVNAVTIVQIVVQCGPNPYRTVRSLDFTSQFA